MGFLIYFVLALLLVVFAARLFLTAKPAQIASFISKSGPFALIGLGGIATFFGRGAIGIPMIGFGFALWRRMRSVGTFSGKGTQAAQGRTTKVKSEALEMEMDLDSGEMDGQILSGSMTGRSLSDLTTEQLLALRSEIANNREDIALLEAYLDRRIEGWREHADTNTGSGEAHSSGSGSMTKQEAYEVLGLEPGASQAEIRKAWRKLMKSMHPDTGGSQFLAAKINAAKDVLLD